MSKVVFILLVLTLLSAVYSFKCNGKNPNDGTVCSGRGKCINENVCACNNGYRGTNCELVPYQNCQKLDAHFIGNFFFFF